jgi:hypothetical protein
MVLKAENYICPGCNNARQRKLVEELRKSLKRA